MPLNKIVHTNAVIGEIDEAHTSYVRVKAQSGPMVEHTNIEINCILIILFRRMTGLNTRRM